MRCEFNWALTSRSNALEKESILIGMLSATVLGAGIFRWKHGCGEDSVKYMVDLQYVLEYFYESRLDAVHTHRLRLNAHDGTQRAFNCRIAERICVSCWQTVIRNSRDSDIGYQWGACECCI